MSAARGSRRVGRRAIVIGGSMSGLFTAALLRRVGWEVFTPIYDLASPRMVLGRVVLIGDAASVGRPHMGFGVSKAAEDARALADALGAHGADIDAELAQFEGVRRPIGERVMLHGRKLGAHLGVNLKTEDEWAMWKLLQDPHAVLGHIAVPHFLAA